MTSFYVAMLVLMGLWWLINVLTLLAFAADKRYAILGQWRTSEKSLLLLAALGGTVGAKLAQRWLRHKTRKQPFAILLNVHRRRPRSAFRVFNLFWTLGAVD